MAHKKLNISCNQQFKYKYDYSQLGSNETNVFEDIYVLGAITSIKMDITLYFMLKTYFGVPASTKIQEFHCIKASNEIFHAKSYHGVSKIDRLLFMQKCRSNEQRFETWVHQMFLKYIVEENEYCLAWLKLFNILLSIKTAF